MATTENQAETRVLEGREDVSIGVERYFTQDGVEPFEAVEWETRTAMIPGKDGPSFEQKDVEFPSFWSQTATNIVAQKYFRGKLNTPQREHSVRQMIGRVADTITAWGVKDSYFLDQDEADTFHAELTHLLLHQMVAFNSPVWFNVGFEENPQCSACQPYRALVSTPDGMVPIGELVENGQVGREVYDAAGTTRIVAVKANGKKPVWRVTLRNGSYVEATPDHVVKAVAERQTTPRWLRVDELVPGMRLHLHPHRARIARPALVAAGSGGVAEDPAEPEAALVAEAALAGWLQADGFVGQYDGTNRSLTIEFMTANDDEFAWVTEHLDIVFPDVHRHVRDVETQSDDLTCRRIRLYGEELRPFVEAWGLMARGTDITVPERLWSASTSEVAAYLQSIFQADGYVSLRRDAGYENARVEFAVIGERWVEEVQLLLGMLGIYSRRVRKSERREDRHDLHVVSVAIGSERARFTEMIGFVGRDKQAKLIESLSLRGPKRCGDLREEEIVSIEPLGVEDVYDIQTESGEYLSNNIAVHNCFILSVEDSMDSILDWITKEGRVFRGGSGSGINLSKLRSSKEQLSKGGYASGPVSFMRGADASAGTIKSGGKTRRAAKMVVLNVDHPDIEEFIWCKQHEEEKARVLQAAGYDMSLDSPDWASIQYQNANNSVRVTDEFMRAVIDDEEWHLTARTDGSVVRTVRARDLMHQISEAAWKCADPGMHYDTTMNDWHTCPTSGRINASNPCSEYLHVDNSACNLASLNLMKFRDPETLEFQVERFERAVDVIFMAQEILVSNSSYPTEEITRNAKAMRQLGLGYANLGALLMARGFPYDSDEGRAYAAAITAIMTGRAYRKSAEMAGRIGPFEEYPKNSDAMLRVIRKHRAAVANIDAGVVPDEMMTAARRAWDEALAVGEANGYRNAQATVLAPTGCLVGESLVMTEYGLSRIDDLGDPSGDRWQDADFLVQTDDGPRAATKFFVNGVEPVVTLETARGYQIKGTTLHRVRVVDAEGEWHWKRLADIRQGDRVPMMLGGMLDDTWTVPLPPLAEPHWNSDNSAFVPRTMTPDLAELIGYFMGDGSLHAKGLRFCVTESDHDVVERLVELGSSLFGIDAAVTPKQGYIEVTYQSVRLVEWWEACGFAKLTPRHGHTGKGYAPHIPRAVLRTNDKDVYRAFVRGLFEADGNIAADYVYWSSTNERFSRDVQTLMLALGYVTTRKTDSPASKFGSNPSHVLRLLNVSTTTQFVDEVGFISGRKRSAARVGQHPQAARHDHIPATRAMLDELAPENDALRKRSLMMLARSGSVTRSTAIDLLEQTESEEVDQLLDFYYDTVKTAVLSEEECTYDLSVPDNVTYVANGFVSHNTISFMMDCDTTGVEPDFSLVKSKKLVGGGDITIVNQTVPTALSKLGYAPHEIDQIVAHVNEHNTVVGAPGFKGEHMPVFDVAVGDRAIHHMGHVKMMASVQPFISGAISKTVNLPNDVTVDDVAGLYLDAWKLGVKAIAIYRDGCKVAQPLSGKEKTPELIAAKPQRRVMPIERQEIGRKFKVGEYEGYIHVGLFPEGDPGDVFVDIAKEGTTLAGLMNAFMIAVSVGIQYGVPLEVFVSKFAHMRFEPSGLTNDPDIRVAKSIPDYIFRWMGKRFLDTDSQADLGIMSQAVRDRMAAGYDAHEAGEGDPAGEVIATPSPGQTALFNAWEDAVECAKCGGRKVRTGACYTCRDCGDNSGCG